MMSDLFVRGHEWEDADGAASYPSFQPVQQSGKRKREVLRCKVGDLSDAVQVDEPDGWSNQVGGGVQKSRKKNRVNKELLQEPSGSAGTSKGILVDRLSSKKKDAKRAKKGVRFNLEEHVQPQPSIITIPQKGIPMLGQEIVDRVAEPSEIVSQGGWEPSPTKPLKNFEAIVGRRLIEMVVDTGEESEELEEILDSDVESEQAAVRRMDEHDKESLGEEQLKQRMEKERGRKESYSKRVQKVEPTGVRLHRVEVSDEPNHGKRKKGGIQLGKLEEGVSKNKKKIKSGKSPLEVEDRKKTPSSGKDVKNGSAMRKKGIQLGKSIFDVEEQQKGASEGASRKQGSRMSKLLTKFHDRLLSGHFRYLNEKLYNGTGEENFEMMHKDRSLFEQYHRDYDQQMKSWPQLPVDVAIGWLKNKPEEWKVADFGCGEARLQRAVSQEVSSLDLVALVPEVIECNMAKTPLDSASHDCAVFCLALMGKDYSEYIKEAARILKSDGILWIAEVCSRFVNQEGREEYEVFNTAMKAVGFESTRQYWPNKVFVVMIFKKTKPEGRGRPLWPKLKNCAYKKR